MKTSLLSIIFLRQQSTETMAETAFTGSRFVRCISKMGPQSHVEQYLLVYMIRNVVDGGFIADWMIFKGHVCSSFNGWNHLVLNVVHDLIILYRRCENYRLSSLFPLCCLSLREGILGGDQSSDFTSVLLCFHLYVCVCVCVCVLATESSCLKIAKACDSIGARVRVKSVDGHTQVLILLYVADKPVTAKVFTEICRRTRTEKQLKSQWRSWKISPTK